MMKSFNDIKKIIALLTLEIKSLDPTSKYSAIIHLEETIDILKLEALPKVDSGSVVKVFGEFDRLQGVVGLDNIRVYTKQK